LLERLRLATSATLIIDNQKNGVRGQTIAHEASMDTSNPVEHLADLVFHIMSHGGTADDLLCTYWNEKSEKCVVRDYRIRKAVRMAVAQCGLTAHGFSKENVSAHSLRAGGATALKLAGADLLTIKKYGRWRSETFEMYIHEQISCFAHGWSRRMAARIPYINMGAVCASAA